MEFQEYRRRNVSRIFLIPQQNVREIMTLFALIKSLIVLDIKIVQNSVSSIFCKQDLREPASRTEKYNYRNLSEDP